MLVVFFQLIFSSIKSFLNRPSPLVIGLFLLIKSNEPMKNVKLYSFMLAIVAVALVGFKPKAVEKVELTFAEATGSLHMGTMCNVELFSRFEIQFADIDQVTSIDAYEVPGVGYYYAVTAINPEGEQFVENFKTTKEEVQLGIYDYIELNERTTGIAYNQRCYEDFNNLPNWCETYNSGWVCGFKPYPWGGCVYY